MSAVVDVQMSAPAEADLFGALLPRAPARQAAQAGADCALEFTGYLAERPRVVIKPIDREGHFAPAVELHLDDVGAGHHSIVAHVMYLPEARDQADALARRLKRGQQVTVTTQLADIRLLLPAATLSTDTTP